MNRSKLCMIGHGMMGVWHSEAMARHPAVLHTVVGRRPEPTAEFAARFGYHRWTTSLEQALADPEVDIAVVAGPSETHAEMALACIAAGKHTLVEIPIAMNLADSERVVAAAAARGVTLGVVHPMRYRPHRGPLIERIRAGSERVRHAHGRFFIHRVENIGATGYKRSWTDNILWHHSCHLIDLGLWLIAGGDMRKADDLVAQVRCTMPDADPHTGVPMEITLVVETSGQQSIVATGSYYGHERIYDTLVVSERDSYRVDEHRNTLTSGGGTAPIASERENAWLCLQDFVDAIRHGREPLVPGWSVLPTMRVLERAQQEWNRRFGARALPGRPQA